jgi:hypothetical protein
MLTVITPARHEILTTLERAREALKKCVGIDEDWIIRGIEDASAAVVEEIERPVFRSRVEQSYGGTGDTVTILDLTPVVALESVVRPGDTLDLTDGRVGIRDADAGFLWREQTWPLDAGYRTDITTDISPYAGETPWTARYVGGWLVPADDFNAYNATLAVNGTFTMPAGKLAPLLVKGDVVKLSGFTNAGNNGRFGVVSATDSSFVLAGTFTAETAPMSATAIVRTLPSSLERAVLDTMQAWWYRRGRDQSIMSESLGDHSVTYGNRSGQAARDGVLTELVLNGLKKYKRYA